jgi:UDP-2,4-diacetamido-2,4,6-trideoxy-beta-L-altropyranose hydrolase
MRVVFRVDAGSAIGAGHVMRCLTLADELRALGARVRFVTRAHPGHLGGAVAARGFELASLPGAAAPGAEPGTWLGATPEEDAAQTLAASADLHPVDWVVVDHYAIAAPWHRRVRAMAGRVMAIDDLADRPLDADVVLDQGFGAAERPYAAVLERNATLLLGPRYALIARSIREEAGRRTGVPRPRAAATVLVSLGGTDPQDATSDVLRIAAPALATAGRVDVVIGASHPNVAGVAERCHRLGHATLHVQTPHMARLLGEADLAIGAGGGSTWERMCVGVPAVTLTLADNQAPTVRALAEAGLVVAPGADWRSSDALLHAVETLLDDTERRAELSRSGRRLVDGAGAPRVAAAMVGAP